MAGHGLRVAAALVVALACASADATEYVVAKGGRDDAAGTAEAPFATVQHGLDVALPGDTVTVRAGVYEGRVVVPRSGDPGRPITLRGKPGAVLEGGDRISGFEPVPGWPGVFVAPIPYPPYSMSWNDRYVMRVGNPADTNDVIADFLKRPADDAFWNGLEVLYTAGAFLDGGTAALVRFRDGRDPDGEDITFAPGTLDGPSYTREGVITLTGRSHIVIRGLTLRNADIGVALYEGCRDNVIENNTIEGGYANVLIYTPSTSAVVDARNLIRNNELTLAYHYAGFGHSWFEPVNGHIFDFLKQHSFGDRTAIKLYGPGEGTEVYGNHIFEVFDGITDKEEGDPLVRGRGLKVHHNRIHNMLDDGLAPGGGLVDCEWHDNELWEGGSLITLNLYPWSTGPAYFYRNRTHHTSSWLGYDVYFKAQQVGQPSRIFLYHNSFSGNFTAVIPGMVEGQPSPGAVWVNNVFSSPTFFNDNSATGYWFDHGIGLFDYNWIGGDFAWLTNRPAAWLLQHNAFAQGEALWPAGVEPDFRLPASSRARSAGIDVSTGFTVGGATYAALPGFAQGYFTAAAPDVGAFQNGEAIAPPAAPEQLTYEVSPTPTVELEWLDRSYDETGFEVERKDEASDTFVRIAITPANRIWHTDPDVVPGRYRYRVRATGAGAPSAYSNELELVVPGGVIQVPPPLPRAPGCGCDAPGAPLAAALALLVVQLRRLYPTRRTRLRSSRG